MPKLTPTFNDQAAQARQTGAPFLGFGANGGVAGIPAIPTAVTVDSTDLTALQSEELIQPTPVNITYQPMNVVAEQVVNVAPAEEAKPLKIALIGTAPSSRALAPYSDPSWTIWSCSPGNMGAIPRYDAWFEIHGSLLWPENKHYGEPYIEFLKKQTCPVYMQDHRYCPNATPLPKDSLVKEFGPYYFTSSFAWMIAMAIVAGAKEIALYGIDMASKNEYILQRPGIYHYFQEARKRGIKITAPYESDILQPPGLYGYSEVTPFGRKLIARSQELTERLNGMRQQRDGLIQNITYLEGALEDCDYVTAIWGGVQNNSGLDIDKPEGVSNG